MKDEICPGYCPFLKKEALHCRLFDVPLVFGEGLIYKCDECKNADMRKAQYKKKIKDFEHRERLWDKAMKRQPPKIWQQIKVSLHDFKERKEMKEFLSAMAGDFPILLDKKTSKLLLNLYLTLDSSEKSMMKDILNNPKMAEIFLTKVKGSSGRPDLLKIVRKEMDDLQFAKQKEERVNEEIRRARMNAQVASR